MLVYNLFLWNLDKLSNGCSHRFCPDMSIRRTVFNIYLPGLSTEINSILGTFKRELKYKWLHSLLQNYTMNYWVESGAPKSKLVMGMPLYGQSFTLTNAKDHGLNAAARDGGTAGVATRAKGFLAYHEVCRHLKAGWTVVQVSVHIPCRVCQGIETVISTQVL